MNNDNVVMFETFTGVFIKMDKGGSLNRPRSYLRVHANVDTLRSLKSDIFIKNEDDTHIWLAFKY